MTRCRQICKQPVDTTYVPHYMAELIKNPASNYTTSQEYAVPAKDLGGDSNLQSSQIQTYTLVAPLESAPGTVESRR